MFNRQQSLTDWLETPYASQFLAVEREFTDRAFRHLSGPNVLLLSNFVNQELLLQMDFPNLQRVCRHRSMCSTDYSLAADNAFLPFSEASFASVLLPHALESHDLPHQVLREAHRVLQPDGHLLLTCFNPFSIPGVQNLLRIPAAAKGQYYSLSRVKDWLNLLGFEVVGSAMYHYAPLTKNDALGRRLNFLNSVGDRWLPMFGGAYIITARKREAGLRLVGKTRFARVKRSGGFAPAPAGSANTGTNNSTTKSGMTIQKATVNSTTAEKTDIDERQES